jgi:PAS domain S-box-containing protein
MFETKSSETGDYRKYVEKKISKLAPIFAKASVGDFSQNVELEEDEFTELYAGVQVVLDSIREKMAETEKSQKRLNFLFQTASILLESPLNYKDRLKKLAQLVVPTLADWCAIDILDENGKLQRLAVVHQDPSKVELAYELQRRYPPDPNVPRGAYNVIRTGKPEIYPDISDSLLVSAARDEEHLKIIHGLGLKSAIAFPLIARGNTLGVISLVYAESDRRYGKAEIELVEDLAKRASISIDNALLYERAQKALSEVLRLNSELEQKVQERTASLLEAQKIAHIGSWEWDISKDTVTWSDELYRIYGLKPQEFGASYSGFLEHVHPDDREFTDKIVRKAYQTCEPFTYNHRIVRPDGEIRTLHARGFVVTDVNGKPIKMFGTGQDITEAKLAEEKLRESEEKYRRIVETTEEGIWVIDAESNTAFVNKKMAEMLGYTVDEMLGRNLFTFMDDEWKKIAEKNVERRRSGIRELHDFKFLRKDGSYIWALLSTSPILDNKGKYTGALAMVTDITDRKLIESALKEKTELYENLLKAQSDIGDGVSITEGQRFVYVNDALCKIYGYTREELLSLPTFLDLVVPEHKEWVVNRLRARLSGENVGDQGELEVIRKDGKIIDIEYSVKIIHIDGHTRLFSIIRDVTERKRIEKELYKYQSRFARILDIAEDAIISVDENQIIKIFNQGAEKIFGYNEDEVTGKSLDMLIPPRFIEIHRKHIAGFEKSKDATRKMGERREVFGRRKDGTEFPAEATISKLELENEKIFTVMLRDITERKQMEEKLRRMERLSALGQLASTVAHEIRNPLGAISLNFQYLLEELKIPDTYKNTLKNMELGILRIQDVVKGILDFARSAEPNLKKYSINEIIDSSIKSVENQFQKDNIMIVRNYGDIDVEVLVDMYQIIQVFVNLFLNAKDAMQSGGKLTIRTTYNKNSINVHIEDTGKGIPTENLSKIFEPFFTTKTEGIGLGLAVVYKILEQHQSQISVESEVGVGTKFTVSFPLT